MRKTPMEGLKDANKDGRTGSALPVRLNATPEAWPGKFPEDNLNPMGGPSLLASHMDETLFWNKLDCHEATN